MGTASLHHSPEFQPAPRTAGLQARSARTQAEACGYIRKPDPPAAGDHRPQHGSMIPHPARAAGTPACHHFSLLGM
jgi:hypothetical protein